MSGFFGRNTVADEVRNVACMAAGAAGEGFKAKGITIAATLFYTAC